MEKAGTEMAPISATPQTTTVKAPNLIINATHFHGRINLNTMKMRSTSLTVTPTLIVIWINFLRRYAVTRKLPNVLS
jgi:hypothetical protein